MKAPVNKIIPFSSVDGPGNRFSLFFQGCNFNCLYCHNPETINLCNNCGICLEVCPKGALNIIDGKVLWKEALCVKCDLCIKECPNLSSPKVKYMSVKEILNEVYKYKLFLSGVTVSGGECMLYAEFLKELFKEIKNLNLTCFLDSNGYILFEEFNDLLNLTDAVMLDVKSYDEKEHIMLTGKSNKNVLRNLIYLGSIGKLYEVRTVVVPDVLDNVNNIDSISKMIANIDDKIRYKLIKFRPLGVRKEFSRIKSPTDDFMIKLKEIAVNNGCKNVIIT
ncbi:YjjW family glycine radical enzyme activase [Caloramator sp. CAR-1]|uniref:YjjW family glycine radical enzyme activase n=1 Tax=Caloramator sp. CAR-1 TaxID=3062777 RepID=UPI0026E1D052|nr:YjjW family glycine radical enzyme activase [Caloramator sp. CAR-1]MDO6354697.1 YjjW family glycine radical enzyme activase [Caloramator sp. CAR-1]